MLYYLNSSQNPHPTGASHSDDQMQIILDHINKLSQEIAQLMAAVLPSKTETRLDTAQKAGLTFLGHVHLSQLPNQANHSLPTEIWEIILGAVAASIWLSGAVLFFAGLRGLPVKYMSRILIGGVAVAGIGLCWVMLGDVSSTDQNGISECCYDGLTGIHCHVD